jgi:type II secretory pathway pseudopilin PulG
LVELLVVLAIIGLLLALALPAVQWTRESARKTQCVNKLRQLGIAMHGYAERQGRLPRDGDRDWGYGAFFLPELEQSPLFERLSPLTTTRSGGADPATTGAGLPVFHCPAYSGPATTAAGFGRSTYRGCTPVLKTRIQLSDIVDGESQTVAIGETASEHGWALPGTGDSDALPNQGGAFGSFHAGGVLFLVCDGSVRLIADGIDKTQYEALFTTAGNEPVHW